MATQQARIEITAADKTRAAFDSAQRGLQGMQAAAGRLNGLLAGLGVGLGVGGLATFVKSSIDAADAISKLSVKTGIAVEELAGWQHVMDLSGTTAEQFEMAVGKLNTALVKQPEKLRAIGVTATDANGALLQIADAFTRIQSPTERAALAAEIFGERVGRNMVVALSQGRAGIEELIRVGQELNPITTKMAQDAEKFNDALDTLRKRSGTVGVSLANVLLPSLNNVLAQMEEGIRIAGGFGNALKFGLSVNPFKSPGDNLKAIRDEIKILEQMRGELQGGQKLSVKGKDGRVFFGYDIAEIDKEIAQLKQRAEFVKVLRAQALGLSTKSELAREAARQRSEATAALQGQINVRGALGGDKDTKAADEFKRRIAEQTRQFEQAMAAEDYRIEQETARLVEARAAALYDIDQAFALDQDQVDAAEAQAAALGRLRDQYRDMIDPLQKYREQLEEVRRLADAGLIDADQALEAEFAIQQQIDAVAGLGKELDQAKDFAKDFGLTFNSALEDALVNGKRFSDVLKSLEQDIARIIIRKSVTEPLGNAVSEIFNGIDFGKIFSFGGGRAGGGPVYPGQYYVVGERGPEVLLPRTAGTVVPAGAGGGPQIIQYINIDSRSDLASIQSAMNFAKDAAKAEILASMQRGGAFARATGRA